MATLGESGRAEREVTNPNEFLAAIQQNVSQLEKSIQKGHMIDREFDRILLSDINALHEHCSQEKSEFKHLVGQLDKLREKVLTCRKEQLSSEESTPLIGKLVDPTTLPVEEGYEVGRQKIAQEYVVRRIRPDGHCMFRSYVTGLLGGGYPHDVLAGCLRTLKDQGKISGSDLGALLASLHEITNQESLEHELSNPQVSDKWVEVCRNLAAQKISEKFASAFPQDQHKMADSMRWFMPGLEKLDDAKVVKAYCKSISKMENPVFGGELELGCLDEIFGTTSCELNVQLLSVTQEEFPKPVANPKAIYLVQRGGDHIDVAFPKHRP